MSYPTHADRCQREVSLMLNKLLRGGRLKGVEYRAVTMLENLVSAPAYSLQDGRKMIDHAYELHHLPSPYDVEAWLEREGPATGGQRVVVVHIDEAPDFTKLTGLDAIIAHGQWASRRW